MNALLRPSIPWLFVFIPVSVVMEHPDVPPTAPFFAVALAIDPIARLIVISTEPRGILDLDSAKESSPLAGSGNPELPAIAISNMAAAGFTVRPHSASSAIRI